MMGVEERKMGRGNERGSVRGRDGIGVNWKRMGRGGGREKE